MKVKIDLDCTPEEARTFFGLPDVQPMQMAMMKEMQDRIMAAMHSTDAETLMKTWMPAGVASLEQMQKMFWQQFRGPMGGGSTGGGSTGGGSAAGGSAGSSSSASGHPADDK